MKSVPGRLSDKVAIITGAASGIGAATARAFATEGASVIVVDLQKQLGGNVVQMIRAAGGMAEFIAADVSNPGEVVAMIETTAKRHSRVDVLVANAGLQYEKSLHETTLEEWDHVINVNLKGMFLCCREVIPHMVNQGGGNIIAMGSVLSQVAEPRLAAYCASKGGILMLTKSIATDYGQHGIRANCICPGYIDTPLGDVYFQKQPDPQEAKRQAGKLHLLGRMGMPDEVARCAVFLASDESSFMTGAALVVDGGLSAKV